MNKRLDAELKETVGCLSPCSDRQKVGNADIALPLITYQKEGAFATVYKQANELVT
jgi:hypothetical protein